MAGAEALPPHRPATEITAAVSGQWSESTGGPPFRPLLAKGGTAGGPPFRPLLAKGGTAGGPPFRRLLAKGGTVAGCPVLAHWVAHPFARFGEGWDFGWPTLSPAFGEGWNCCSVPRPGPPLGQGGDFQTENQPAAAGTRASASRCACVLPIARARLCGRSPSAVRPSVSYAWRARRACRLSWRCGEDTPAPI